MVLITTMDLLVVLLGGALCYTAVLMYRLGFCTTALPEALQALGTLPLLIVNLSGPVSAVLITPQGAGAILPARRQQGP